MSYSVVMAYWVERIQNCHRLITVFVLKFFRPVEVDVSKFVPAWVLLTSIWPTLHFL